MEEHRDAGVCKFCSQNRVGRYTCPRCNARYCSVDCYKCEAHLACSELFYRDCFMEGLRTMDSDASERQRMVKYLKKLEADGVESDDEEPDDLVDRFSDVNLDSCDHESIWNRLTESERADFGQMLKDERIHDLVSLWAPWWCISSHPMVEEVGVESTIKDPIPPVLTKVKDFSELSKSGTSDLVPYSIVNVLYGYAYTTRLYNGDYISMPVESARTLMDVSECLGRGVFGSVSLAIAGCLSRLTDQQACDHFVSREFSVAVVDDVCKIAAGKRGTCLPYVLAALSDCHQIFGAARNEMKRLVRGDREDSTRRPLVEKDVQERQRFFSIEKKLEFFISFVARNVETVANLLPDLELESCELTTQLAVHKSECVQMEKIIDKQKNENKLRPLIVDITSN